MVWSHCNLAVSTAVCNSVQGASSLQLLAEIMFTQFRMAFRIFDIPEKYMSLQLGKKYNLQEDRNLAVTKGTNLYPAF